MKFKLDENVPQLVGALLRGSGFDAHTVVQEGLAGARDSEVLRACIAEARILITLDLDFADIRAYPPGSYPGIWVLRPARQTFHEIEALVRAGVGLADAEWTNGQLWVIDATRVRMRRAEAQSEPPPAG